MNQRLALPAVVSALSLVAASTAAVTASATSTSAIACTLLPAGQIQATLGLSQSTVLRNFDPTGPASSVVDTECGVGVWSGAPPTSTAGMFALARSGNAAQVGIETWAPHTGHQRDWVARGFAKLTGELGHDSVAFPGLLTSSGMPSKKLRVPKLGHTGVGLTFAPSGLAKGLTVAVGCWWEHTTYKAVCVFDEEAASKPVTAHMLKLATTAVAKFVG